MPRKTTTRRRTTKPKVEEVKEENNNNITLSKEALDSLVSKMVEEKMNAISGTTYTDTKDAKVTKIDGVTENLKELIHTLRDKDGNKGYLKYDYEVDVNDYMDTEKLFFAYNFTYFIFGDVRYGQQVGTPYKRPIEFKPLYRYNRGGKGSGDVVSISVARIRSKKEYNFLLNHSLFNIRFFETQGEASEIDKSAADRLAAISGQYTKMTEFEVIQRAKSEGIPMDSDVNKLKRALIFKMAQNEGFYKKPETVKPIDSNWTPNRIEEVLDKNRY